LDCTKEKSKYGAWRVDRFLLYFSNKNLSAQKLNTVKGKGKVHPRTGHEGPEGE
jgi:hypothetical protein